MTEQISNLKRLRQSTYLLPGNGECVAVLYAAGAKLLVGRVDGEPAYFDWARCGGHHVTPEEAQDVIQAEIKELRERADKLEALLAQQETPSPVIRCGSCGGTQMFKVENGEMIVLHDCCSKYGKFPDFTPEEIGALKDLSNLQELSVTQVLRQGLRMYQAVTLGAAIFSMKDNGPKSAETPSPERTPCPARMLVNNLAGVLQRETTITIQADSMLADQIRSIAASPCSCDPLPVSEIKEAI